MKDKKALVVGLGVSGMSAAAFLLKRGASVTGIDKDKKGVEEKPEYSQLCQQGLQVFSEDEFISGNPDIILESFDIIVVSPGVPQGHPIYQAAIKQGVEVVGEIELACRNIDQPFIGITGTNGKTTVSLLIAHVLNVSGKSAKVVGNAGIPLTSEIMEDDHSILVCELSSYQLETMRCRIIDYAALLNITPDHLDRYESMEDYAKAKISIASCLKTYGKLYIEESAYKKYVSLFGAFIPKTYGYSQSCDVYTDKDTIFFKEGVDLLLPKLYRGKSCHDVENIMAAFALCSQLGVTPEEFSEAFESFQKPPHRIEFVTEVRGVAFYNDSKGTNPDAVIRAVESMSGNVVLIAGGQDKGTGYSSWILPFKGKVQTVCAIGQAKKIIEQELGCDLQIIPCETLEKAVKTAFSIAKEGENVLLSPGCSSFDMFKNYEHRGNAFKQIVHELDT